MRAVNLLPRDAQKSRSITAENLPALVGAGVGFVVLAGLAGGYLNASSKVASAQKELSAAQQQLAATPVPPAPTARVDTTPTAVAAEHAPRLQAVSDALSQRIAWDRVLREFSLVLPSDVWVQTLTMSAPTATSPGTGFAVSGTTYSYDSVARLLSRLYLIPDLTGVTLASSSGSGAGKLVQFSVTAGIKGAAPPPAPAAPATTPTTPTTTGTDTSTGAGTSS